MLTEKDFYNLADAMVPLEESPIYIDDTPTAGPTEIIARCAPRQQIAIWASSSSTICSS